RGQAGDVTTDRGGAGERGHRDQRRADDGLTGEWAGTIDDVDDSTWDPGALAGLGEHERRQGSDLGGLEDNRVACGDRGKDLPDRHLQRVVPGRDRADHADRLATDR